MNHKFKLKQRVAALCMAAMMCCSLLPAGVFAEAPRADADGTLILEQDKEAVTDDSHQTEASDPDPGEESTPKSSEAAATSQSADEDAPVETSTDYTFDGAVLYTDLPDAPTGSYMGSQGLPVATGETKIGISAWLNDQLEESTESYLSADTLNSDDLTLMAPLLEGTDYAVAPILAQVEYPADGSSLDVVLPNEVTVLDFYGLPADETTRSSLVHSEYTETSAAVMGLYVQADADFSAKLVDGSVNELESCELAYKIAGSLAFREACEKGGSVLLEPFMKCEIVVPDALLGDAMGNITARRGRIDGVEMRPGGQQCINALCPLSEMFGYATDLRSRTQGRGSFTMHFDHYEEVAKNLVDKILGIIYQ